MAGLALAAAGTLAAFGGTAGLPGAGVAPAAQAQPFPPGLGGKVWDSIPTHAKVVALTFDAGSNADGVSSILSTLAKYHVRATFFLTGDFTSDFPSASKAIVKAGQRIGDHSVTHPYFVQDHLTDAQMRWQVTQAQTQIKSVTGAQPWPWFRFPFGDYNAHAISVVNSVGFVPIGWTVDTLGWEGTSGGQSVQTVVNRVMDKLQPGEIVLMHCGSGGMKSWDHSTLDADALPTIITKLRAQGYAFVTVDALRGLGYLALTSNGGVHNFGPPWYGSVAGRLPEGVSAVAVAANTAGGYWILKSDGGVANFNAPWYGSLAGKLPDGQTVTAIAAAPGGGYLVLTSDGGVHNFGATWYGSSAGRLAAGVTPVGIAVDRATGGYWILKSDGGIDNYNAPWLGSLRGKLPAGESVTAIAAARGGGYLVLTSDGGVHNFGAAWYGSDAGKLPAGVSVTGLAANPASGGYWILKSDGGIDNFNSPWYGSLAGIIPPGQTVTAIAGE